MVLQSLIPELNTGFGFSSADIVFVYECMTLIVGWNLCLRGEDKNFFHRLNLLANLLFGIVWFSSRYPGFFVNRVEAYVLNFLLLFLIYLFTHSVQERLAFAFQTNGFHNWLVRHRMVLSMSIGLLVSAWCLRQITTLSYIEIAALCLLEGILGTLFQAGHQKPEGSFYTYGDILKRKERASSFGKEPL